MPPPSIRDRSVKFPLSNIIDLEFGDVGKSHQHRKVFKRPFTLAGQRSYLRDLSGSFCGHRQRFTRFAKCPPRGSSFAARVSFARRRSAIRLIVMDTHETVRAVRTPIVIGPSPIFRSIGRDQQSASKPPVRRPEFAGLVDWHTECEARFVR
jgi:hypothetical protein